ncbi:ORF6N domain-containing protein, partial [Escherichia coli]|nr:ORF6N domain-containing protein [Escherichia coli]HCX4818167.1 ORF6N domain-containing protein [Escherichia coli]
MVVQNQSDEIPVLEWQGVRVVTTETLARGYGTETIRIRQNHHENKVRFVEGKHFFKVEGESLRELKHRVALNYSVKIARNVRSLTLWTERGAARHAKMLETDQAWAFFEKLE